MKKLIMLILVLAIASTAQAGFVWTVSGNSGPGAEDVAPGDVLTLVLSLDATWATAGIGIGMFTDGGAGGNMSDSDINAAFTTGRQEGMTGAEWDAFLIANSIPTTNLNNKITI